MNKIRYRQISAEKETYFAGANTADGFVSSYPDIVDERRFDKVYIIKGGPGSGKSTAIRAVSKVAEDMGADVTEYLCGSAPTSLDLAVITKNGTKIAVLDGTAPHTLDPKYAGAVGEIVDFGSAFNKTELESLRYEIEREAEAKSIAYADAYRQLAVARTVKTELSSYIACAMNKAKASKSAGRLLRRLGIGGDGLPIEHRYISGITMDGAVMLDTPIKHSAKVVTVGDDFSSGSLYLAELIKIAEAEKIGVTVFPSPIDRCEAVGVYFRSADVYFALTDGKADVNMLRFHSKASLAETRNRRRTYEKLLVSIVSDAEKLLAEAKLHHFNLEEIYKSATDYTCVDSIISGIVNDVKNRIN